MMPGTKPGATTNLRAAVEVAQGFSNWWPIGNDSGYRESIDHCRRAEVFPGTLKSAAHNLRVDNHCRWRAAAERVENAYVHYLVEIWDGVRKVVSEAEVFDPTRVAVRVPGGAVTALAVTPSLRIGRP